MSAIHSFHPQRPHITTPIPHVKSGRPHTRGIRTHDWYGTDITKIPQKPDVVPVTEKPKPFSKIYPPLTILKIPPNTGIKTPVWNPFNPPVGNA